MRRIVNFIGLIFPPKFCHASKRRMAESVVREYKRKFEKRFELTFIGSATLHDRYTPINYPG